MRIVLGLLVCAELVLGAGVRVLFEPRGAGPFPSDALTVADERQKTGRRIALTVPIERERLRVGEEVTPGVIADFDGYAPQHRLSVRFSGPVNVDTLRDGLFYVTVGEPPAGEFGLWPVGKVTLINEVVWDPATNTAYAKPDGPLDQSRRHAVVVTDGVKDLMGDPVEASPEFTQCVEGAPNDYCGALQRAMGVASVAGRITGGSVYTTMSVTAFLEAARRGLEGTDPMFARAGSRNVVEVLTVKSLTLRRQVRTSGNRFEEQVLPAPGALFAAAGVGRIAFGSFRSPRFLGREVPMMPVVPTGTPVIVSPESDEIFFHAWLPVTPPPAAGYPVILAGHGLGDDRFGMPSTLAIGLVKEGHAVVAFNAFGHGFGPEGTVRIERLDGEVFEFPYGGRGMDISGTGRIGATDGAAVVVSGAPLFFRDSLRQTALDWSQMVRAIQRGMDLLGTGRPTLDGSRVSYYGQSLGAFYGSSVHGGGTECDQRGAERGGRFDYPHGTAVAGDGGSVVAIYGDAWAGGRGPAAPVPAGEGEPEFAGDVTSESIGVSGVGGSAGGSGELRAALQERDVAGRADQAHPLSIRDWGPDGAEPGEYGAGACGEHAGDDVCVPV
jgi:hypothetical protein